MDGSVSLQKLPPLRHGIPQLRLLISYRSLFGGYASPREYVWQCLRVSGSAAKAPYPPKTQNDFLGEVGDAKGRLVVGFKV